MPGKSPRRKIKIVKNSFLTMLASPGDIKPARIKSAHEERESRKPAIANLLPVRKNVKVPARHTKTFYPAAEPQHIAEGKGVSNYLSELHRILKKAQLPVDAFQRSVESTDGVIVDHMLVPLPPLKPVVSFKSLRPLAATPNCLIYSNPRRRDKSQTIAPRILASTFSDHCFKAGR